MQCNPCVQSLRAVDQQDWSSIGIEHVLRVFCSQIDVWKFLSVMMNVKNETLDIIEIAPNGQVGEEFLCSRFILTVAIGPRRLLIVHV